MNFIEPVLVPTSAPQEIVLLTLTDPPWYEAAFFDGLVGVIKKEEKHKQKQKGGKRGKNLNWCVFRLKDKQTWMKKRKKKSLCPFSQLYKVGQNQNGYIQGAYQGFK